MEARLRVVELALDDTALPDVGHELGAGLQQPADQERDEQRREGADGQPDPRQPAPGYRQRGVKLAAAPRPGGATACRRRAARRCGTTGRGTSRCGPAPGRPPALTGARRLSCVARLEAMTVPGGVHEVDGARPDRGHAGEVGGERALADVERAAEDAPALRRVERRGEADDRRAVRPPRAPQRDGRLAFQRAAQVGVSAARPACRAAPASPARPAAGGRCASRSTAAW